MTYLLPPFEMKVKFLLYNKLKKIYKNTTLEKQVQNPIENS